MGADEEVHCRDHLATRTQGMLDFTIAGRKIGFRKHDLHEFCELSYAFQLLLRVSRSSSAGFKLAADEHGHAQFDGTQRTQCPCCRPLVPATALVHQIDDERRIYEQGSPSRSTGSGSSRRLA